MSKSLLAPDEIERAREMARVATLPPASIQGLADCIGYNRTTLSLFISGQYQASAQGIARAVLFQLDKLVCPFIGEEIHPDICKRRHSAPKPFGNPEKLSYWTACQACPNNPDSQEQ
jgi:hypothetical protein